MKPVSTSKKKGGKIRKMEIVFIEEELDGFVANITLYKDGVYTVLGASIAKIKEVKMEETEEKKEVEEPKKKKGRLFGDPLVELDSE